MQRRPQIRIVVLAAGVISEPVLVPLGTMRIALQTRGTVTVQVALNASEANTATRYFSLISGAPFLFDVNAGDELTALPFFFYAASTETVEVVWW